MKNTLTPETTKRTVIAGAQLDTRAKPYSDIPSLSTMQKTGAISVREFLVHLFGEPVDFDGEWTISENPALGLDGADWYTLETPVTVFAFYSDETVERASASVERAVNGWLSKNGHPCLEVHAHMHYGERAIYWNSPMPFSVKTAQYQAPGSLGEYLRSLPAVGEAVPSLAQGVDYGKEQGVFIHPDELKADIKWPNDVRSLPTITYPRPNLYAGAPVPKPVDPYKEHAVRLLTVGVEKATSSNSSGIHNTIRRDHVEQLRRELDRKLVVMTGALDCWDGEP